MWCWECNFEELTSNRKLDIVLKHRSFSTGGEGDEGRGKYLKNKYCNKKPGPTSTPPSRFSLQYRDECLASPGKSGQYFLRYS